MRGVIDSDDVPGGCLVRFAAAAIDGFPALHRGDPVEFDWCALDQPKSGYATNASGPGLQGSNPLTEGVVRSVPGCGGYAPTAPPRR